MLKSKRERSFFFGMIPIDLTEAELVTAESSNFSTIPPGRYYAKNDQVLEVDERGSVVFYKDGKMHRDEGPACISPGRFQQWRKNGMLHREDGPAFKWGDGKIEFWLFNRRFFSRKEWKRAVSRLRLLGGISLSPAE